MNAKNATRSTIRPTPDFSALSRAIEALLAGDMRRAEEILTFDRTSRDREESGSYPTVSPIRPSLAPAPPKALAEVAPELAGADADVAAAQSLLTEAVRRRSAILAEAARKAGKGPFKGADGCFYKIIARPSAGGGRELTHFTRRQ